MGSAQNHLAVVKKTPFPRKRVATTPLLTTEKRSAIEGMHACQRQQSPDEVQA